MSHCPICARASDQKYRPFCSKRCADIDLGKWLTGSYVIASDTPDDPAEVERAMADVGMKKPGDPLDRT